MSEEPAIMTRCIKCNLTPRVLSRGVMIPKKTGGHIPSDKNVCHVDGEPHDFQDVAVMTADGKVALTITV